MKEIFNSSITKKFIWLVFLTGTTWFLNGQMPDNQASPLLQPVIRVLNQPGSPLQISSPAIISPAPLNPGYTYTLTNFSNKPIQSYAIKSDVTFGENVFTSGVSTTQLPSLDSVLPQNISIKEEGGRNKRYSAPVKEIVLSVDYVEFLDGTSWGADKFKSANYLAGRRAGGRAAINHFRERINRGDLNLLLEEINRKQLLIGNQSNSPEMRDQAFESGIRMVQRRLKDAYRIAGVDGIRQELERGFDASEGRRQK